MVAVLNSVLQKQYMLQSAISSCVVGCVQVLKLFYWFSVCKSSSFNVCSDNHSSMIESEYSKTGDFILDLYWSGCRGDWPSANT